MVTQYGVFIFDLHKHIGPVFHLYAWETICLPFSSTTV